MQRNLLRWLAVLLVMTGALFGALPAAHASSTDEWTGNGDGTSWNDGNNWSTQQEPSDGDTVVIQSPDAHGNPVHVTNTPTISLQDLTLEGSGPLSLAGGGTVSVEGNFQWDSGELLTNVTVSSGGSLSISGSDGNKVLDANLEVDGSGTMANTDPAGLPILGTHVLHVGAGASLEAQGSNHVTGDACCQNPSRITNDGTMTVDGGPLGLPGGTLELDGVAYDQNGSLTVESLGLAHLVGSPFTVASGASFSGGGRLMFEGGDSDLVVGGPITLNPSFTLVESTGATFRGVTTLSGGGTFALAGGALNAAMTIASGTSMAVSGTPSLSAYDTNSNGTIVNHGTLAVQSGTFSLAAGSSITNASGAKMSISPGAALATLGGGATPGLVNHGTVTVPAPPSGVADGVPAKIGVGYQTDAVTNITSKQELDLATTPSTISQGASVTGAGMLLNAGPLTLSGSIPVASGTSFTLYNGTLLTAKAANLGSSGSTVNWNGGNITGALTVASGVNFNVSGTVAKQLLNPASGTSVLKTKGTTTVQGGPTASTPTTITIVPGAQWLNEGQMTVQGGVTFASPTCCSATPAAVVNPVNQTLTFSDAPGTVTAFNGVALINSGAMSVQGGTVAAGYPFYRQSGGSVDVATGAVLGCTASNCAVQLYGGRVTGGGTLAGAVANTGATINPGPAVPSGLAGILSVSGSYTQGPGGHLEMDVAGTTPGLNQDQLAVTGPASLGGVLTVVNGSSYTPAAGDTPTILTASGGVKGGFNCGFTQGLSSGQWKPSTSPNAATVSEVPVGPVGCDAYFPMTPVPFSGGTLVVAGTDVDLPLAAVGGIPSNAVALAVNVTVRNATASGTLSIGPGGASVPTSAAVSYSSGVPASSFTTVKLSASGTARVHLTAGSAMVYVDISGYYLDGQTSSGGDLFHPLTPTRLGAATSVTAGQDADVLVVGSAGVPLLGADAVTALVTVSGPTSAGTLTVSPGGTSPATVTTSFAAGQTITNEVECQLVNGQVRLHASTGTVKVTITVLGWWGARSGGGSYFVATSPARLATTFISSGGDPWVTVNGNSGIPLTGVVAGQYSAVASGPTQAAALSAGPWGNDTQVPLQKVAPSAVPAGPGVVQADPYGRIGLHLSAGQATVSLDTTGFFIG